MDESGTNGVHQQDPLPSVVASTEQPIGTKTKTKKPGDRRSRTGCVECRRIRRKCDEARPQCHVCIGAGKVCSYNQPLRWGGRPFKKSAFGQQLGAGVGIIVQQSSSSSNAARSHRTDLVPAFVYGPLSSPSDSSTIRSERATPERTPSRSETPLTSLSGTEDSDIEGEKLQQRKTSQHVVSVAHLPAAVNWMNWLSPQHQFLVHHFMTKFSRGFSLHPSIHERFCSTLMPFALDKTHGIHLLAAMLVASARHRKALGSFVDDSKIDKLAAISIGHLARQPIGKDPKINQVAAATALVLCMAEIQAGGEKPGTWKVHLQGAKAILTSSESMEQENQPPSPTLRLLRRWCQSLDIMSMSASGAPHRANPRLARPISGHIDMFEGFSTSLIPVFMEMAELANLRTAVSKSEEEGPTSATSSMKQNLMDRGRDLDNQIGDLSNQLHEVLDLSRSALPEPCSDYQNLNEAYHCAARTEIRQNTLLLPFADAESAAIVKRGIAALRRMKLDGAAPSSKTLHVAFSLGCAAWHREDRDFILEWIDRLYKEFGMLNTLHAREIINEHWNRCNNNMPYIRPRQLARKRPFSIDRCIRH